MSTGAQQASGGATYRMLRELGSRAQRSYAAIREPHELVVAQRFVRTHASSAVVEGGTPLDAEAMALLLRDARCLSRNWHPNIARVRYVDLAPAPRSQLTIASELLEGATLADLFEAAHPERTSPCDPLLALPILVRIVLDVLAGLTALHGLRDGMNAPVGALHGELCPANIVVGKDGVARIINVLRKRPVVIGTNSEALGYAAPEALDAGGTDDPRSDVYAAGVILWEGLAGRRLYVERDPALVLLRQREGDLAAPTIHPSSPFARLADVAMRALAFDPSLRFRSPSDMAGELRKITGQRLASGSAVAARVADLAGQRIRMRRALLDPAISGTRRRASDRAILAAEAALEERAQQSSMVRASPRRVLPTLEAEVPVALIAASRRPPPLPAHSSINDLEGLEEIDPDEEDLPGPRGSSPELALEAALQLANAPAPELRGTTISPVTPNLPFPAAPGSDTTKSLISAALASTTANMRALAAERAAQPATETPGDIVIPIDVMATINEEPPAESSRRGLAIYVLAALAVLIAMATFVSLRGGADARRSPPPAVSSPPPPAMTETPAHASPAATTPNTPPSASITAPRAAPQIAPRTITAPPAPEHAAPPPAKPKKSIYEPDDL